MVCGGGLTAQRYCVLERYRPRREPGGSWEDSWEPYAETTCGAYAVSIAESTQAAQPYLMTTDVLYFDHDPDLQVRDRIRLYATAEKLGDPRLLLFKGTRQPAAPGPPWKVRALDETWVMLQQTGLAPAPGQEGPANA